MGGRAMMAMIAFSIGIVISMVVWLIVRVIVDEAKTATSASAAKGSLHWMIAAALIVYLIHLGTLVFPAILGLEAKDAAARRGR